MWFYAALGMSFVSGLITITSKHTLQKVGPVTFFWTVMLTSIPIIWIFAWRYGVPEVNNIFFIGITGSIIFYSISKILFLQTIKEADLSHVHPLMALSPIFTLIFSYLILREGSSVASLVGVGITLIGSYVLNISSMREGLFEPFKILFRNRLSLVMIVSVLIGSIVSVFDKLAIISTTPQNPFFTILVEDSIIVIALIPWIFLKRKSVFPEIKGSWKLILLLGFLTSISNILAFMAIGAGNPGLVASVFRTQIFFVLLFSFFIFNDRPKTETIIGSIIMILGLIVLKIWS
jgi:drug/metabolite transporter (DMT)-like permease